MQHTVSSSSPVKYDPAIEQLGLDEAATAAEIVATLRSISETTYRNSGHALRSVHAKSHALLVGEIEILGNLPPALAQGLFSRPARYPVVMRISTIAGDLLDDNVSLPRGLALKIVGVPGERLDGSEAGTTQDFVLVNSPTFGAQNAGKFLQSLKLVAKTTDRLPRLKKAFSTGLQALAAIARRFGGSGGSLNALGGHPETNPLGETYFSQAAVRYGDYVAKIAVAPVSTGLAALKDAPVDLVDKPDGLRLAARSFFETASGEWDLRVQLCADLAAMPVEDGTVEWSQTLSPFVTVARMTILPQDAWNLERSRKFDDGLAFSPWNGLAAHQPLGWIMRIRKPAYRMSSQFRAEHNRCPMMNPTTLQDLTS